MDEALKKSGEYPNIAITPGTHRHAATGKPVEIPEWASVDGASSDSDAVAFCKRVERAAKERAPLELFGVSYEAVDNEPFCETVERWLNGDAPKECRECTEGKYAELVAKLGSGECELHDCDGSFSAVNRPVWRCDCGAFMTQYTDATTYHKPRFCPNCGRRVKGGAE